MVQRKFKENLYKRHWANKKVIAAVSGGVDSMALASLLKATGVDFCIAHCNFELRGADSDADEEMVARWASEQGVPFFVKRMGTRELLDEQGGNLQQVARQQRYAWFEQLRQSEGYDWIATAHHMQDSVETLLMNFFKGTGMAGLHGILPQTGRLIRPLLDHTKEQLVEWALSHNVPWREDRSNETDDYLRNAMRHHLLPVIEKTFPGAVQNLYGNIQRFQEIESVYSGAMHKILGKLVEKRGGDLYLPVLKLAKTDALQTILWELLKPFGFTPLQIPEVARLLEAETGKYVQSPSHRVIRNRSFLIITEPKAPSSTFLLVGENDRCLTFGEGELGTDGGSLDGKVWDEAMRTDHNTIYVDEARLKYPLILRPWKTGDYFYPFGMGMKKKKVGRFLISAKVPLHDKSKVWVLESDKRICWVLGMRMDERFRLKPSTEKYRSFTLKTLNGS